MSLTQIKETCLYVSDLARTRRFYHEKLELPVISFVEERHVFFRVGTSVLLCFLPEVTRHEKTLPPHYAHGKQHIAFSAPPEQYADWKRKLAAANIPITHETDWGRGYFSCYFDDPDGHVLEIVPDGLWQP